MAGGWCGQGQVPPRTEDAMPPPPPPPTHHPWHHYARPHTACSPGSRTTDTTPTQAAGARPGCSRGQLASAPQEPGTCPAGSRGCSQSWSSTRRFTKFSPSQRMENAHTRALAWLKVKSVYYCFIILSSIKINSIKINGR